MRNITDIKEIAKLETFTPSHAEGKYCIDLTDPDTGKVKERYEGKNYVYKEGLAVVDWRNMVSASWLCLNDSNIVVDQSVPYLLGQTIGYGKPSTGSAGLYRGAFNSAQQSLAQTSLTSTKWKFVYSFTDQQANSGTIRNIGLTNQYDYPEYNFSVGYPFYGGNRGATNTDRYHLSISSAGVVTVHDWWTNITSSVDLSATVGAVGAASVGYNPSNGRCYVKKSGGNLWEFSNITFSTLLNTYACPATTFDANLPLFIYGNYMYIFSYNSIIKKANYVTNSAWEDIFFGVNNCVALEHSSQLSNFSNGAVSLIGNKYVRVDGHYYDKRSNGVIFNLSTGTAVGSICSHSTYSGYSGACTNPKVPNAHYAGRGNSWHAITATVLDAPVTKTTANGMTVTYELEVFWP